MSTDHLSVGQREHPVWQLVREVIQKKLESSRRSLEMANDQDKTNTLRGEIRAYKSLLALEDPPREIPEEITL